MSAKRRGARGWRVVRALAPLAAVAWLGVACTPRAASEPASGTSSAAAHATAPSRSDPLHAALAGAHRHAVNACFGGFGKGGPYAAELTVASGAVTDVVVSPIAAGSGEPPRACIEKVYRALALPNDTGAHVRARFAVQNPSCSLPACSETDLPCRATRDIDCSVVVDAR